MNGLVTPETLYGYFEKKATRHEIQLIEEWLKQEGNDEIFYMHLAIWESSHLQFSADTEKALTKFQNFVDHGDTSSNPVRPLVGKRSQINLWRYATAAAAVVLIALSTFFYFQDYLFYNTIATDYGMTKNFILEDGTEVTLNANSTLKVPKHLSDTREVWLTGEAFFSVTKKSNKARFFVHTNNLNVEVLGTKFNVNSRHENTEVVLNEGSIKLTSNLPAIEKPLMMVPGELASLSTTDIAFTKKTVKPETYNAWRTNFLIFDEASLSEVVQEIRDYYGVEVEIASLELANRKLTGTMPNNDLGIVLKSLGTSLNVTIKREGNKIIFR